MLKTTYRSRLFQGVALPLFVAASVSVLADPMSHEPDQSMQHHHHESESMPMSGLLGQYPTTREASGTSWQPDSTPMDMPHLMRGDWALMPMAFANAVYSDSQA